MASEATAASLKCSMNFVRRMALRTAPKFFLTPLKTSTVDCEWLVRRVYQARKREKYWIVRRVLSRPTGWWCQLGVRSTRERVQWVIVGLEG